MAFAHQALAPTHHPNAPGAPARNRGAVGHALLSTFADFFAAAVRPSTPLARAVVLALVVKLCVVVAMRVFLFGGEGRQPADTAAVRHLLLGPAVAVSKGASNHD